MSNEDGTIWVTYNGELYNELELRRELEAKGHRYRTSCDTESLVHLYEEEGPEFVRRLNGMFALAIWDGRRGRLVLARDRMGQKPLFYGALPGGGLAFGSEPKAILAHPEIGRALDRQSLVRYLFYEYVPAPHSIWRSLRKLAARPCPDVGSGRSSACRVLEPAGHRVRAGTRLRGHGRAVLDEFRDAVARHRRSDVPIGVFLSGGVDSSSVAAALCEVEPARTSAPSRSASRTRASTRAATPARSPATWEPTITSGPSRSRRPTSSCPRSPPGSTSRSATPRSCRLTS